MKPLSIAALIFSLQLTLSTADDTLVRPQANLYQATNGAWLAATSIPADKAEVYGADLPGAMNTRVRELVESLGAGTHRPGSVERKIADYTASYIDTAAIDHAGLAPMRKTLDQIDRIATAAQLATRQGEAQGVWKTPVWL